MDRGRMACDFMTSMATAECSYMLTLTRFKLRLRPKSMPAELKNAPLESLPPNSTLITVFADFMRYLLHCTEKFFEESSPTGSTQWDNLIDDAHFIISHPNGWEGVQQARLRKAAVIGKLVPDTLEGRSRIHFVTEGEASLHFCLNEKVIEEGSEVRDSHVRVYNYF